LAAINAGLLTAGSLFGAAETTLPRTAFLLPPSATTAVAEAAPAPVTKKGGRGKAAVIVVSTENANPPVLLAYAPAEPTPSEGSPFSAVMGNTTPKGLVLVPHVDANHAWVNDPLPASIRSASEVKCLAT